MSYLYYGDNMRILLIEDDKETAKYILNGLKEDGHIIDVSEDGKDGLFMAMEGSYDVMIFDRMLPKMDGLTIAKTLRMNGNNTPILFLTAMSGIEDRVVGLETGDDYLVKPFAFSELLARVKSLARRPALGEKITELFVGDLQMDLLKHRVTRGDKALNLQPQEFKLLEYMLRHKGELVTRTMLLENVWDFNFDPQTNIVETHISRLRGKLGEPSLIHTERGAGYIIHD